MEKMASWAVTGSKDKQKFFYLLAPGPMKPGFL